MAKRPRKFTDRPGGKKAEKIHPIKYGAMREHLKQLQIATEVASLPAGGIVTAETHTPIPKKPDPKPAPPSIDDEVVQFVVSFHKKAERWPTREEIAEGMKKSIGAVKMRVMLLEAKQRLLSAYDGLGNPVVRTP